MTEERAPHETKTFDLVTVHLPSREAKPSPKGVCGAFPPELGLDHAPVDPVPCDHCDSTMCTQCPRPVCAGCHHFLDACVRCAAKMQFLCLRCVADPEIRLALLKERLPQATADVLRLAAQFALPTCRQGVCTETPFVPAWRCCVCLAPSCAECRARGCDKCENTRLMCSLCALSTVVTCPTCHGRWGACLASCQLKATVCCNDPLAPKCCAACVANGAPHCASCRMVMCAPCVAKHTHVCAACQVLYVQCAACVKRNPRHPRCSGRVPLA